MHSVKSSKFFGCLVGLIIASPLTAQEITLGEALDNDDLVFFFPDGGSQNSSDMFIFDEEAFDGEDAIFLRQNCFGGSNLSAPRSIATTIQGPAVLQFYYDGQLGFFLDEKL